MVGSDASDCLTADTLRSAIEKVREHTIVPSRWLLHPHGHERACVALGLPLNSPLTNEQVWDAVMIDSLVMVGGSYG